MRHLLVSKPIAVVALVVLLVQMACVASSISPTPTGSAGSSNSTQAVGTQPSASGSQATQSSPVGGAQNAQMAPSSGGAAQSTQSSPSTGAQPTQSVPSTGGQAAPATPSAGSSSGGTTSPTDAQALLAQVAQHYQTAGRQQALKDFTDENPPFNAPGMFVMCLGADHKITAMGGFPLLVGVSADALNEVTGQSLGNLIWDAASLNPQGQASFRWKNPLTGTIESKVIYYQKLSQDICGVVANQP